MFQGVQNKMAGDYILENTEAPARFEKLIKAFIIFGLLCLAGELVWLLGIGPSRPFSRIEISGNDRISREEILALAGISGSSSFFTTEAAEIEKALLAESSIGSVKVSKSFPGTLRIILDERRPAASALSILNGETVVVLFDSQGVIFEIGKAGFSGTLPLISGLAIEDPYPGMKLPSTMIPFLESLIKIENSSPELLNVISEIKISMKAFDGFDLVLYPVHKKIKILLPEISEEKLRYALLMVDVLSAKGEVVDTLDFRSEIASYIPKEAYFE